MSFRWEWVLIPLALLIVWWFLGTVDPRCTWDEIMSCLHVRHKAEYTRLAWLGIFICAGLAVLRILRSGNAN